MKIVDRLQKKSNEKIQLLCVGLLVPAVVETVFRYPHDLGAGYWILIKNVVLVVFALIALTTGSVVSIREILHLYA